jgi:hypothetical protein
MKLTVVPSLCLSACSLQGTASSIFYGALGGAKKMSEAAAH